MCKSVTDRMCLIKLARLLVGHFGLDVADARTGIGGKGDAVVAPVWAAGPEGLGKQCDQIGRRSFVMGF